MELCAVDILEDQIELLRGVDHIMEGHDVGMLQLLEDSDLPGDALLPLSFHQFELFVYLDGEYHAGRLVNSLLDRRICS